jgi:hypothetical protein
LAITWQSSPSRGAAVQHGVAEHLGVFGRTLAALVRRVALEDFADLLMQLGDLIGAQQATDDGVALALELEGFLARRLGARFKVGTAASDHAEAPST